MDVQEMNESDRNTVSAMIQIQAEEQKRVLEEQIRKEEKFLRDHENIMNSNSTALIVRPFSGKIHPLPQFRRLPTRTLDDYFSYPKKTPEIPAFPPASFPTPIPIPIPIPVPRDRSVPVLSLPPIPPTPPKKEKSVIEKKKGLKERSHVKETSKKILKVFEKPKQNLYEEEIKKIREKAILEAEEEKEVEKKEEKEEEKKEAIQEVTEEEREEKVPEDLGKEEEQEEEPAPSPESEKSNLELYYMAHYELYSLKHEILKGIYYEGLYTSQQLYSMAQQVREYEKTLFDFEQLVYQEAMENYRRAHAEYVKKIREEHDREQARYYEQYWQKYEEERKQIEILKAERDRQKMEQEKYLERKRYYDRMYAERLEREERRKIEEEELEQKKEAWRFIVKTLKKDKAEDESQMQAIKDRIKYLEDLHIPSEGNYRPSDFVGLTDPREKKKREDYFEKKVEESFKEAVEKPFNEYDEKIQQTINQMVEKAEASGLVLPRRVDVPLVKGTKRKLKEEVFPVTQEEIDEAWRNWRSNLFGAKEKVENFKAKNAEVVAKFTVGLVKTVDQTLQGVKEEEEKQAFLQLLKEDREKIGKLENRAKKRKPTVSAK